MKRKTREQRRRESIANVWRVLVMILLLILMCAAFCCNVQSVESVSADDYLASIGADALITDYPDRAAGVLSGAE